MVCLFFRNAEHLCLSLVSEHMSDNKALYHSGWGLRNQDDLSLPQPVVTLENFSSAIFLSLL